MRIKVISTMLSRSDINQIPTYGTTGYIMLNAVHQWCLPIMDWHQNIYLPLKMELVPVDG